MISYDARRRCYRLAIVSFCLLVRCCPETASTRAVRLPLPHSVRLALRAFE
jgi:hypothetical protein